MNGFFEVNLTSGETVSIAKDKIVYVLKEKNGKAVVYLQGIWPNQKGMALTLAIDYDVLIKELN